jgi:hypothetical protein
MFIGIKTATSLVLYDSDIARASRYSPMLRLYRDTLGCTKTCTVLSELGWIVLVSPRNAVTSSIFVSADPAY